MSAQKLLMAFKKHIPVRVYGKGPVIELMREMGARVDKKTPLQVTDAYCSNESGEIVCNIALENGEKLSAALTNLKLDIKHPLFNKVRDYRNEVAEELAKPTQNINNSSFRVGNLYEK